MRKEASSDKRALKLIQLQADLVVVGGGLSGVCTAITAARAGIQAILVQDRPVLGGNASSEVRLWVLGATSHMGNNNRWAREGGVIDELLVENTYTNPEGNALIFDMILLDKVKAEPNITLLLNTAVYEVEKNEAGIINKVVAFCSQNSTQYYLQAPLFCDASGDGIVGFLSGAAFRMGAESKEEFGELMAPSAEYGELLGHSLYFYSKDVGKPVRFTPPAFALTDITKIPRFKNFNTKEFGCKLWWVEYGGRLDTVHDTEQIKWELWKVVYGVWNYIKNSGNFPEAENLTLEWVGTIPGKRESRRFEGDYMLTQQDLVEQRPQEDAVAYGGWSIDLHPADGVYSERNGCNQWHSKGLFHIPYRSLYSSNIENLFLAGRIISVSHVAFGATRVMATSAYVGQSVGMAAALCTKHNLLPRELTQQKNREELQQNLLKAGQFIPGLILKDETDLVAKASISASSEYLLKGFASEGLWQSLATAVAQLYPLKKGNVPAFRIAVKALENTVLKVSVRISSKQGNFTPDTVLAERSYELQPGVQNIDIVFNTELGEDGYAFITFDKNEAIEIAYTQERVTGLLSLFNSINKAVSNYGKQTPEPGTGVDAFEFWCPQRRPLGYNLALEISEPQSVYKAANITNGIDRPTTGPNAWVADLADAKPTLTLEWPQPQTVKELVLWFDTDFDHPMESVLMTHPETVMPFCVRDYTISDANGNVLKKVTGNYQTCSRIRFDEPATTSKLYIQLSHPSENTPAALFAVRCYSN